MRWNETVNGSAKPPRETPLLCVLLWLLCLFSRCTMPAYKQRMRLEQSSHVYAYMCHGYVPAITWLQVIRHGMYTTARYYVRFPCVLVLLWCTYYPERVCFLAWRRFFYGREMRQCENTVVSLCATYSPCTTAIAVTNAAVYSSVLL